MRIKKPAVGLLFLLFPLNPSRGGEALSVEWKRFFGGAGEDWPSAVMQTADRGYVIAGVTDSFGAGRSDVYLIRTDSKGKLLWQRTFGGAHKDEACSLDQTRDGGFIIAGWTLSFGAGRRDVYLIKTDSNGNQVWQKTFGGAKSDRAYCVRQTPDGGYIVAGSTRSFGRVWGDVYLVKTDAEGNLVWQKNFGGSKSECGYSLRITRDGGYIIVGSSRSFGSGGHDVYLLKTDAEGNLLWERTFGGSDWDCGKFVEQTPDGGYVIAGTTDSLSVQGADVYLLKTDPEGNLVWHQVVGGPQSESVCCLHVSRDGGFAVAGKTDGLFYLITGNDKADLVWRRSFVARVRGYSSCGCRTTDGGFVFAGSITRGGDGDVYLLKLAPEVRKSGPQGEN